MVASDSSAANPLRSAVRLLWVLWGALFLGPLVALVGLDFVGQASGNEPPVLAPASGDGSSASIGLILGAVGIVSVGTAFVVPGLLSKGLLQRLVIPDGTDLEGRALRLLLLFRTRSLIGWALSEGGAMLAAIAVFLVGYEPLPVSALVLHGLHMLWTAPVSQRLGDYLRAHLPEEGGGLSDLDRLITSM